MLALASVLWNVYSLRAQFWAVGLLTLTFHIGFTLTRESVVQHSTVQYVQ